MKSDLQKELVPKQIRVMADYEEPIFRTPDLGFF